MAPPNAAEALSEWLPVVVQTAGLVLLFILVALAVAGYLQVAIVFLPVASGMMIGRYVRAAARPAKQAEEGA